MSRKNLVLLTFFFITFIITLSAEDSFIIRENTNFAYHSNSITLDDGVVSIWADTKTSLWKLYGQKVDANGNQLWNNGQPLLINEVPSIYPDYFKTVKTSDNAVIIVWIKYLGSNDYKMYAQKISSSGQLLWTQNSELILESTFYPRPYIAANDVGGIFIFYKDSEIEGVMGLNLNSDANDLWSCNTNPLLGDVGLRDIKSDNNGGVIIIYNELSGDENLFAARVNSDREILWNEIVASPLPSYYYPEIVAVGSNDFVTWWRWDGNIIGQRFDLDGNRYWGDEGIQINNQPIYEYSDVGLFGNDNSFFLAYIIDAPPPSNDEIFKILKFDLNANALWNDGTELSNTSCGYIDLIANTVQECVIAWNNNSSIYIQKVDSDGNKLWGDEGIIIDSEFQFEWTQGGFRINELNGQVLCTWQPILDGKSYLKYQSLDDSGNLLLPEDGVEIQSGMQSNIYDYLLIGNDDSSYYLWEDIRYGQNRIFVQRTSPDGDNYFPEFGIIVTDTAYHHQEDFVAKALPEGGITLAWTEVLENEEFKRVRWQIINPDGTVNSLNGNDITVEVVDNQINPKIDIVDGDIIIAWLENDQIIAQKLVNYTPVWGSTGSLLIENGDTGYFTLTGSYIKFDYLDENYFQRIDENGNLAADWPFPGVAITSSFSSIGTMDDYNGDLVYTWRINNAGLRDFGFQILNASGEFVYPDNGFTISENVTYFHHDYLFDGCINLFHEAETGFDIIMERYDLQGNEIWSGTTIQNNNYIHRLNSTKMGENFLVTWHTDFNEYTNTYMMQMIDADGNPITSNVTSEDFEIYSDRSSYQLVSVTDTDASILFKRGYDVGSKTTFFFSGLVSYLINSSDVPITEDEIVATAKIQLSNFPNPFNPSTTISFNLTTEITENTELIIFNIKGQKVKTLVKNELKKGNHSIIWNGIDEAGKSVSSGIYLYRLNVNGKTEAVKKCLLLK